MLADAWVDARPSKVEGLDCMTTINVRYKMNAMTPAKVSLLGDDIGRLEQLLRPLNCDYKMIVEQKNDFGQPRRATFVLNGKITCLLEIVILGDGGPQHVEVARLVLAAGANPNIADKDGVSPLSHANRKRQREIAQLIAGAGGR